jgi:hypothetical protein
MYRQANIRITTIHRTLDAALRNPLPKLQEIERQFRAKYDREMTAQEEKYFLLAEDIIIEDSNDPSAGHEHASLASCALLHCGLRLERQSGWEGAMNLERIDVHASVQQLSKATVPLGPFARGRRDSDGKARQWMSDGPGSRKTGTLGFPFRFRKLRRSVSRLVPESDYHR